MPDRRPDPPTGPRDPGTEEAPQCAIEGCTATPEYRAFGKRQNAWFLICKAHVFDALERWG